MNRLTHTLTQLVEPHPSAQAPEQRRRLKMLSSMSLLLTVLIGLSGVQVLFEDHRPIYFVTIGFYFIVQLFIYAISRTRYYRLSIQLFVIGIVAQHFIGAIISGLPNLLYLVAVFLAGSVFLNTRQTLVVASLIALGTLILTVPHDWEPIPEAELTRSIIIGLAMVLIWHTTLQGDLRQIQRHIWGQRHVETQYQLLAENITDCITIQDLLGCYIYVSPSYTKLLGYTLDDLASLTPHDLIHPDDWERNLNSTERLLLDCQRVTQLEYQHRTKAGTYVWLESHISPIVDDSGRIQQILTSARDITARKRMEAELRASESRLKEAQQIAHLGYWKLDWASGTIGWSDEHYALFGIPLGTPVTYQYYNSLLHPDDRQQVLREFQGYLDAHVTEYRQGYRVILPNQQTRHVSIQARISYTADGTPHTVTGIVHNVTEQHDLEEARLKSELAARTLLAIIPDLVFEMDATGSILSYKADAHELYVPADQLIGQTIHALLPSEMTQLTAKHMRLALETGQMQAFEYTLDMPHRGQCFYEARLVPTNEQHIMALVRDITERVASERLLVQQNEYLATLYQVSLQLLNRQHQADLLQIIVDEATNILDAPYGELMLVKDETLVVEAFTQNQPFLVGDRAKRGEAFLSWQAYDTKQSVVIADYSALPQRRTLYEENSLQVRAVASFPILVGDTCLGVLDLSRVEPNHPFTPQQIRLGELFSQMVALVLDNARLYTAALDEITNRMAAEEEQARLLTKIEAVNRDLNDFAYIVSHDLKAPLRGIGSIASWLKSDYAERLDDEGRNLLNLLSNRVRRTDTLIAALLDYSRIGRVAEQRTAIDLLELIQHVIELIVPKTGFEVRLDWQVPTIEGDPVRFQQIFQNLLQNAVNYMDKREGVLTLTAQPRADDFLFCVADNGPGIEGRYFERIFQIFQTLRPRDEHESTGIGLTIVKRIVENYGGRIWVESRVGVGSAFYFTVPQRSADDD